jgi:putative membrane protein
MKRRVVFGLILGIAAFAVVLATHNMTTVFGALAGAGWRLSWVVIWRILSIFASAVGWWCLFPVSAKPPYPYLALGRWISEAINHLLPVVQIGGDVVRARLAYLVAQRRGLPLSGVATAAVQVIDITCALSAQVIMVTIGFLLLWWRGNVAVWPVVIGIAIAFVPLVLLVVAQRRDVLRGATGILGKAGLQHFLQSISAAGDHLAAQFSTLYRRKRAIAGAISWHVIASVLRIGETWSALWVFGHPISLTDALLVDVMAGAARSLAFFIPGALGAEESGILLICGLVGIEPSLALALALSKRARDLVLGLPGLLAWLVAERTFMAKPPATGEQA